MAIEQFGNNPVGTLNGAITNVATTLVLTAIGNFPTSAQYRIKIENEYLIVTGISGVTLTVTRGAEGSVAASHADLTAVYGVLTAGAMAAFPQIGIANVMTRGQEIDAASSDIALTLKANGADLLDLRDSGNTIRSSFDQNGYGFLHKFTFGLALGTAATIGTDKTNWLVSPRAGKIVKAFISAKTAPTGSTFIVDILKSTDNGSTFTTIWSTTGNRVQLAISAKTGFQTSFDVTSLAEGDLLRIDIIQVGSTIAGQDVTVTLVALLRNN